MRRTRVAATATATLIAAATALSLTTPQAGATPAGAAPSGTHRSATPSDNITPGWKTHYDQLRQRALEKRLRTGGKGQAEKLGNFSFVLHNSATDGRFDASKLVSGTSMNPAEADLWFCGPPPLRLAIEKGLRELGKPPRRVEFERFEFR